jgi:putative transposase
MEQLHSQRFQTIREARDEAIAWLLCYNRTRMHSTLNYGSTMQFEQDWANAIGWTSNEPNLEDYRLKYEAEASCTGEFLALS